MEEIANLVAAGCAKELPQVPLVCTPLFKCEEKACTRPVPCEQIFMEAKFKYEDMHTVLDMAEVGDYMVSFDLKSGYHHIDVQPEFWKYLDFRWIIGGVEKY